MVLRKGSGPERAESNRGVTLLELLIAISLSGLVTAMAMAFFKDAGNAARLTRGRREAGYQAQAVFTSLTENVLAGNGVLRVGEGRLALLNGHGLRVEYRKEDSVLSVNGKPLGIRVAEFQVEAMGPERPVREGSAAFRDPFWEVDSLDNDRDGRIDFRELDRDGNGELDPEECRYVGGLRVTLTVIDRNLPMTQTAVIHPRNHVPALAGKDLEPASEKEVFPGF